jgi:hypothetical protein
VKYQRRAEKFLVRSLGTGAAAELRLHGLLSGETRGFFFAVDKTQEPKINEAQDVLL